MEPLQTQTEQPQMESFEVFKQWMENRSLEAKQTAVALITLLNKQQYLPDAIGDKFYAQWKEEVLTRDGPDNEVKGFLAALMTMDV